MIRTGEGAYSPVGNTFHTKEVVIQSASLDRLFNVFQKITDPRDPKGVRHDFHGMLTLVFLGLLAQIPYIVNSEKVENVLKNKNLERYFGV